MKATLLGWISLAPEFCIDERMIAVLDAETLGQSMRAVGEIEPFFRERKQMALIRSVLGAACQLDRLCRVLSIIVFFGHGRGRLDLASVSSRRIPTSVRLTLVWQTGSALANGSSWKNHR